MPLPFIIGGLAAAVALGGIGSSVHGGVKMKKANDTMKMAEKRQKRAIVNLEKRNRETAAMMDRIGEQEISILQSFGNFTDLLEKIQGRPVFKIYQNEGIKLPKFQGEELKKISTGAGILIGGLGGAAIGTAGGFAAAGATTSAVMALGTASTGTAIASLSGIAATNATLAALGGGAIAAGGGGMALGTAVLGGATLGVGLLVGGVIFNVTGSKLSDKADEAYQQAKRTEMESNKIISYFNFLCESARVFESNLKKVNDEYKKRFKILNDIVNADRKTEWNEFTESEQLLTENLVMLVGLLYKMCQIKLVLKSDKEDGINTVNKEEIDQNTKDVDFVLQNLDAVKE